MHMPDICVGTALGKQQTLAWAESDPACHPACLRVCMCIAPHSQQWNLVEFLPRALHQPMQLLLAEWMYLPWQEANKAAAAARGASQGGSQAALDTRQAEQIQVGRLPGAGNVMRASGLPGYA